jgi:dTDP-4-dehydrorhamnose 3,5-epimerase
MQVTKTYIDGLYLIQPNIFSDERGYFFESFRIDSLSNLGIKIEFVQENESKSGKNVLRGLHFQNPPFAQGKLVRVVKGGVLDVAVDIRKNSPSYGKWFTQELNEVNKTTLWIPPGFAHGFLTLADDTIFQYKCTEYYNKESEGSIRWDDPDLNITWNATDPIVSDKDRNAPFFAAFQSKFI